MGCSVSQSQQSNDKCASQSFHNLSHERRSIDRSFIRQLGNQSPMHYACVEESPTYRAYPQKQTYTTTQPMYFSRQDVERALSRHDQVRDKVAQYLTYMQQLKDEEETQRPTTYSKYNYCVQRQACTRTPQKENICTPQFPVKQRHSPNENQHKTTPGREEVWDFIHRYEKMLSTNKNERHVERLHAPPPFLSCTSVSQSTQASHATKTSFQQPVGKTTWVSSCANDQSLGEENLSCSPNRFNNSNLSSASSRPEVSQLSLLTKFECIRNQLGLHDDSNRRVMRESSEISKCSEMERSLQQPLRNITNQYSALSELQEQEFSPQPQTELPSDSRYFVKVNSFTFKNSLEADYRLNQIEEQSDETEGERVNFNKHTPSLQDIQIASTVSTRNPEGRIKKSVEKIDRNIRSKEQSYTSSAKETYSSQQQHQTKKSFDTYYQNYVEEEVSDGCDDISDLQRFLEKVKSAKSKLKQSLTEFYRSMANDNEYERSAEFPDNRSATKKSYNNQPSSSSITSYSTPDREIQRNFSSYRQQHPNEKMHMWISYVTQDLESIDSLRLRMLGAISEMKSAGNVDSLQVLKSMKEQIHTHFWNVEQAVRKINEEYASQRSASNTFNSSSSDNSQKRFYTQHLTDDQSFVQYAKKWNWGAKQYQTQALRADDEDDSQC